MKGMSSGGKISPSIMCADFLHLESCLKAMEENQIEYIHYDIMDGEFVSNFTLGTDFIRNVSKSTSIPSDIHLMVNNPELKLDWFPIRENDFVSVHYESTKHIQRVLQMIRDKGARPMLAINPATPLCVLDYVMDVIDGVLIMTVNPGFAGQKLVESTLWKIAEVRQRLDKSGRTNVEIEADGNVSFENARRMRACGADIFVAGTSSIFQKGDSLTANIQKLRQAIS